MEWTGNILFPQKYIDVSIILLKIFVLKMQLKVNTEWRWAQCLIPLGYWEQLQVPHTHCHSGITKVQGTDCQVSPFFGDGTKPGSTKYYVPFDTLLLIVHHHLVASLLTLYDFSAPSNKMFGYWSSPKVPVLEVLAEDMTFGRLGLVGGH